MPYNSSSDYQLRQTTNSSSGLDLDNIQPIEKSNLRKRIVQTIIDLVVIIIIFIIFGIVYLKVEPKIRYFTCDQSDVFFPFKEDTVPFWAVGIFATIGPLVAILGVELLNAKILPCQKNTRNIALKTRARKFFICLFHGISLFVLGISITLVLTEIGKRWVGRLRPHFMSVCKPDFSKIICTIPAGNGEVYQSIDTGSNFCTGNKKDIDEARLSFPSGHSSYSWYCMLFLIIYLEARLFLIQLRYVKPLIQLAAFCAAFVTTISRISDYHHRGSDVIGGTVLGVIIALFITCVVGRVLWEYEVEKSYSEFDLKFRKKTREF